jgi:NAD(P)-dependent dehydrogenase (short-subunit alcohol dehydrogenase family)
MSILARNRIPDRTHARVLITGSSSGIGAATAELLRRRGAEVVGLDLDASDASTLSCDVRDPESVNAAVAEAVERLGGLDVLINNAGIGLPQRASLPPGRDVDDVLAVNLLGPWRVSAAALPALRASRGRIVNVASGLAHLTVPLAPAYCMSKRGLVAFSDALRYEVGHEVWVTTVYPGFVATPIHRTSEEMGFGLSGSVPEEPLDRVATRLVRAALGPPVRDLATTTLGTATYTALRVIPRRLVDRVVLSGIRSRAGTGELDGSELAGEFVRSLREGGRGRTWDRSRDATSGARR